MSDTVDIWHPATGATSKVTRAAFERRSRKLGWQLAADRQPPTVAPPTVEDDPNAEPDEKDQLRRVLTDRGVTGWDGRTGVKKLRQLVEASE